MYFSVCVLGILSVSVSGILQLPNSRFHYAQSLSRRAGDCNICYGEECLPFDQSRCDYYREADTVLLKEDEEPTGFLNPQLQNDIDGLIFTMIEKAKLTTDIDCIPYLSRYTDCTKENVCFGCKTCHCTAEGRWNCTSTSHCRRQDPAIDIDHRVLILAIENMIRTNTNLSRKKRSVANNLQDKINSSTVTLEQISEWFYGLKPNQQENENASTTDGAITLENAYQRFTTETKRPSTSTVTEATSVTDPDYIAFDEVLSNIAVDTKTYNQSTPPPEDNPNTPLTDSEPNSRAFEFDYLLDDDNKTKSDVSNLENVTEISYIVNFMHDEGVTESSVDEATKIVFDLLESAKTDNTIFNDTDYIDLDNNKDFVGVGFDNTNDILEYNGVNIMKRDIAGVSETTKVPNITNDIEVKIINTTSIENTMAGPEDGSNLKDNVLLPLIKVMNNKDSEVESLKKVKSYLVNFMNTHNQSPVVEIIDYPNISASNALHDIEMFPDLGYDLRRGNPNIKQKFLYKLKSDIYEVIKDIIGLQRHRQGDLPDDLNLLIQALKRYVSKGKHLKKKPTSKPYKNYRRRWEPNVSQCMQSTFKQCMIEILQTLDKDMPQGNALGALSLATKKIMRYVVKLYYTDELTAIGLRVHDPNYNMTNDLSTIGSKWQDLSNNIVGDSPFVTLYRMKLLHYFLAMDINKMNDALTLLIFAHSRRMTPYFKSVQNNVMDQINNGLKFIHNKVHIIVQYYAKKAKKAKNAAVTDFTYHAGDEVTSSATTVYQLRAVVEQQQKKRSFIKHIRNLLKSSKKDINELLHRQIPKAEIVKQLARKKLDELAQKRYNEYENAMKKWQKNLGVVSRYKRNANDEVSSRIKSIIPKYLRHKVKPKLHEKKNATHKPEKNAAKKKKKKHAARNKHKKTTLTTATTPKTKATTPLKTRITTNSQKTIAAKTNSKH